MTKDDFSGFADVMAYLALNFPERVMPNQLPRLYFDDLGSYPLVAIQKAAHLWVRCGEPRFPFVCDLVRTLSFCS